MTLTLLDLYNTAASQEWAMYDNDASSDSEMEDSLVLALNKAILEIYSLCEFPFRERTHLILTVPHIREYDMPNGLIKRDKAGNHLVKHNSFLLKHIEKPTFENVCCGVPEGFYIQNDKIVLNPTPCEKALVTIDYFTLVVGENSLGEEIYSLKNSDDKLLIPVYLEELAKDAIITRTMLNSIASESDENFSAYKKQADRAFKLFVKYAKGVEPDKFVKW